MIKRRPSDKLDMVLTCDPALNCEGTSAVAKYSRDRDLGKLDIDVEKACMRKTGEAVTILTVRPLASDKVMLKDMGPAGYLAIIRDHLIAAKNADFITIRVNDEGKPEVTEQSLKDLDDAVAKEIATVIIQMGEGADGVERAFFLEDIFLRERTASRQLPANRVRFETQSASDTPSRTNSEAADQAPTS